MTRREPLTDVEAIVDEIDSADMWATQAAEAARHGHYDAAAARAQLAIAHATIAQALAAVPPPLRVKPPAEAIAALRRSRAAAD